VHGEGRRADQIGQGSQGRHHRRGRHQDRHRPLGARRPDQRRPGPRQGHQGRADGLPGDRRCGAYRQGERRGVRRAVLFGRDGEGRPAQALHRHRGTGLRPRAARHLLQREIPQGQSRRGARLPRRLRRGHEVLPRQHGAGQDRPAQSRLRAHAASRLPQDLRLEARPERSRRRRQPREAVEVHAREAELAGEAGERARHGGSQLLAALMRVRRWLPAAVLGLACAGCAELDKSLNTAERAIGVANSPTAKSVGKIATADDRTAAARAIASQRGTTYERDPQSLINDIRQVERDYQRLVSVLTGNVNRTWGKKETKVPTRSTYVKYTQNYMSRAVVDFDAGKIMVETLDTKDPKASLKSAIVTTLLTPNDPRSVDLYSDSAVKLSSDRQPYLKGLVLDQRGREIDAPAEAEGFANFLLAGKTSTRSIATEGGAKEALFVEIAMVANFANKQAEKFRPAVAKAASQYKVSQSLVFAIIRTESNFNPYAVSAAPAYGLMQLVPTSGGREAHRRARGSDGIPTKEELFDANNNIEFGTAYLSVLLFKQLEMVGNSVSREYCVISAYNTGPGNVLRTFNRNQTDAVNEINRLEPSAVYERLRAGLPYAETRDYLQKVVGFRRQFITAGQ